MGWKLAEAKNKLSEVFTEVLLNGPQEVSRRHDTIVMISKNDYLQLKEEQIDFKTFLLKSTPKLTELDLKRDRSSMREISL